MPAKETTMKASKTIKTPKVKPVEASKVEPIPIPTTVSVAEKKEDNTWLKILLGVFGGCLLFFILGIVLFVIASVFIFRKVRDVAENVQNEHQEQQNAETENETTQTKQADENIDELETTIDDVGVAVDDIDTVLNDLDDSLKENDTPPEM